MIIERQEGWGRLLYDTSTRRFSHVHTNGHRGTPYPCAPVVLNVYVTMNCNMNCLHCVTKDFSEPQDLVISRDLLDWINAPDYMVVVLTGGEPLLPEYESELMTLLQEIRGKALIIDTNGTILPSRPVRDMVVKTNTLLRVSLDSPRSFEETCLRQAGTDTKPAADINIEHYHRKIENLTRLRSVGIEVAVQSVLHRANRGSIADMPKLLRELSVSQWYIQRFIPSYKASARRFEVSSPEYDRITSKLADKCRQAGIQCTAKRDRRHNCIVQLVGDGSLYTQGERHGEKLRLGRIDSHVDYFDYISPADHAERYYSYDTQR